MCSDFVRTISSVPEKTASLLYYPFRVKTVTCPDWAEVISSAKLAERQGAWGAAQVEMILLPTTK